MLKINIRKLWKWTCFIVWLPWFFLTLPWQLKKAYGEMLGIMAEFQGFQVTASNPQKINTQQEVLLRRINWN
jgi:hypothetical protein